MPITSQPIRSHKRQQAKELESKVSDAARRIEQGDRTAVDELAEAARLAQTQGLDKYQGVIKQTASLLSGSLTATDLKSTKEAFARLGGKGKGIFASVQPNKVE